jgi:hypothetical protein
MQDLGPSASTSAAPLQVADDLQRAPYSAPATATKMCNLFLHGSCKAGRQSCDNCRPILPYLLARLTAPNV